MLRSQALLVILCDLRQLLNLSVQMLGKCWLFYCHNLRRVFFGELNLRMRVTLAIGIPQPHPHTSEGPYTH
jgi:hypothetical protein